MSIAARELWHACNGIALCCLQTTHVAECSYYCQLMDPACCCPALCVAHTAGLQPCPGRTNCASCQACLEGTYQDQSVNGGYAATCLPCPTGSTGPPGSTDKSQCEDCSAVSVTQQSIVRWWVQPVLFSRTSPGMLPFLLGAATPIQIRTIQQRCAGHAYMMCLQPAMRPAGSPTPKRQHHLPPSILPSSNHDVDMYSF